MFCLTFMRRSIHKLLLVALTLLLPLGLSGCGQTQFSKDNQNMVERVLTAVSTKNEKWLASSEKLIEQAHEKGQLSDSEYYSLKSILQRARGGDWSGATSTARALAQAQRPTGEAPLPAGKHATTKKRTTNS